MKKLKTASLSLGLLVVSSPAHAGWFDDVVRTIAAPVTLPTQTTINIIRGDDPAQPFRDARGAAGRTIQQSVETIQRVDALVHNVPRDAISNNLGGDWLSAYDLMTGSQRIQSQIALTGGRFLGGCIAGRQCSVNQWVALPVAGALRDAYGVYIGQSSPLPPQVISILQRVVPLPILLNARVAIGAVPNFTFPGFINAGYSASGGAHAVTVGNLMIFSKWPNIASPNDLNWLIHELHHTEQYASFSSNVGESIDGFATQYVQYSGNMEAEAVQVAALRQNQLYQICYQYGGC